VVDAVWLTFSFWFWAASRVKKKSSLTNLIQKELLHFLQPSIACFTLSAVDGRRGGDHIGLAGSEEGFVGTVMTCTSMLSEMPSNRRIG
jgi:hypothetical protein